MARKRKFLTPMGLAQKCNKKPENFTICFRCRILSRGLYLQAKVKNFCNCLEGTRLINHLVDNCTATLLAFAQTYASGFWMQLNQRHPGTAVWLETIYDPASTISKSLVNIFCLLYTRV